MKLSIIILNYHTRNLVKYAIAQLIKSIKNTTYEIIVVDNGTYDGVDDMISQNYPQVRFLQTGSNLGFAAGNNEGVKISKGEYIMILNPDIFVQEGAIDKMVAYMESHPDVGILGPQLLNGDNSVQLSCRKFQTIKTIFYRRTPFGLTESGKKYLRDFLMMDVDHNQIMDVDWMMGACHLFRKKDIDAIGCYDNLFKMYVEDMEVCRRYWINGKRVVYYPEAKMIHLHEQASASTPWAFLKGLTHKLTRWHIISFIKYLHKYWGNKNYGPRQIN